MEDLGLIRTEVASWFHQIGDAPIVTIEVPEAVTRDWIESLVVAIRRCYISDGDLDENIARTGQAALAIVNSRIPDPGSIMSGDFGEILVFCYQSTKVSAFQPIGPKKLRLKPGRNKPAPGSDVIHFVLPRWPDTSSSDAILCSEVKSKSTQDSTSSIKLAIEGSTKDRLGRLAKTLVWLREQSLTRDLGGVTHAHLNRYLRAIDYHHAAKEFRAIVVVCKSLLDDELAGAPKDIPPDCKVVVIAVPELKKTYTSVFEALNTALSSQGLPVE